MSILDPSIADQLREAAEACEKAAAEQTEKARRFRAALAALEGAPVIPTYIPVPAAPPWSPYPAIGPIWVGDPVVQPSVTWTTASTNTLQGVVPRLS
jgi:hypothetical protein